LLYGGAKTVEKQYIQCVGLYINARISEPKRDAITMKIFTKQEIQFTYILFKSGGSSAVPGTRFLKVRFQVLMAVQWNPYLRFALGMGFLYLKWRNFLNGGCMKFEQKIVL
jgi:hypothetical protein